MAVACNSTIPHHRSADQGVPRPTTAAIRSPTISPSALLYISPLTRISYQGLSPNDHEPRPV